MFYALIIVVTLLGSVLVQSIVAALLANVTIHNSGQVNANNVNASSGSPSDIQAAVNFVAAAGGGTVHVPAGNWTFNPPADGHGLEVYSGVNLVGAGMNKTWLIQTQECATSTMIMVYGNKDRSGHALHEHTSTIDEQKPVLIQGISFIGFVPNRADGEDLQNNGLGIICAKDFLVYDCYFENFANSAVATNENDGWDYAKYWNRGVISHCVFDNPYKENLAINGRIWGYGIIVGGPQKYYNSPLANQTWGKYEDVPFPACLTYIEDCRFSRCRHDVAGVSLNGEHVVIRHCVSFDMCQAGYGSHYDLHGGEIHQSMEAYDNTIIGYPITMRAITNGTYPGDTYLLSQYLDRGILLRGGSGLLYDNTIVDCGRLGVGLTIDDLSHPTDYAWIWGNTITYPHAGSGTDISTGSVVHAYLRAPNQAQDGFTYSPYPYPHPLVAAAMEAP